MEKREKSILKVFIVINILLSIVLVCLILINVTGDDIADEDNDKKARFEYK